MNIVFLCFISIHGLLQEGGIIAGILLYTFLYFRIFLSIQGLSRRYPAISYGKQKHLLTKIQDTGNIVHRTMTALSPSKQAPWDLTQFSQSPSAAPSYLPESHQQCEIPFLSKVILILGKARSCRMPNLGCKGAESLG